MLPPHLALDSPPAMLTIGHEAWQLFACIFRNDGMKMKTGKNFLLSHI